MNPQEPIYSQVPGQPGASSQTTGFCQQCGTGLNEQTRRAVGGAVYCEPCLEARLAGAAAGVPQGQPPQAAWIPQTAPFPPAGPNPVLAGLLGLIPGVGAMYNEQYAKGIAHLVIFALLTALADGNGIFGLFVAGWVFYMAAEAYHTARARRDGLPLPNPFGLNDLGDRLGFTPARTSPVAGTGYAGAQPYGTSSTAPSSTAPSAAAPSAAWGAPAETYAPVASAGLVPAHLYPNAPYAPYEAVPAAPPEAVAPIPVVLRFPAGAVWLILLGVVFLLSTTGIFHEFSGEALVGWSLIGLSGWIFLRRFKELQLPASAQLTRINRSLQSSVWVFTSGVLALLDAFHLLRWGRSWPIFLIVAGVLALLGRMAAQQEYGMVPPVSPTDPTTNRAVL